MLDENRVHDGHRQRMREKFESYGQEIFADYELIEMLLYNVLPQLDTNPIAKDCLTASVLLTVCCQRQRRSLKRCRVLEGRLPSL